jgi:hypothetical protein
MAETPNKFICEFCKKEFIKEQSLLVHSCEPRRRRQEQGERGVQLGLQAYLKFYQMAQGSAKLKTFDDFASSPYYKAFVKFGRYCVDIKAINPARFTEWLLKANKKIDYWCRDTVYTEYLLDYLKLEAVDDALARAIEFGLDWEDKTGNPPHDCLRYGNSNAMAYAVSTGRVSPWVIYNSESGQKFLSELNPEQVAMVWPYIDADVWQKKFKDYPADQEYAKDILKKAGW